ncbi:MAG: hypothetical protein RR320_04780 [Oscillospiraceae bacterium]
MNSSEPTAVQATPRPSGAPAAPDAASLGMLLAQLREDAARQTACLKKQLFFTRLGALALCLLLCAVCAAGWMLWPRLDALLTQTQASLQQLDTVAAELAKSDIPGTFAQIDALTTQAGADLTRAVDELTAALAVLRQTDIGTLNRAIADFQAAAAPLARLFGGVK